MTSYTSAKEKATKSKNSSCNSPNQKAIQLWVSVVFDRQFLRLRETNLLEIVFRFGKRDDQIRDFSAYRKLIKRISDKLHAIYVRPNLISHIRQKSFEKKMVSTEKASDFVHNALLNCPLCRSESDFNSYKVSFHNYVECKPCGAKWHLLYKGKEMILIKNSNDLTGDYLLGIKKSINFWKTFDTSKIDWNKTTKPTSSMLKNLILEENEEVLSAWNGAKFTKVGNKSVLTKGNLALTNQRLIWFQKYRRGVEGWKLIDTILLENVTQVVQKQYKDYEIVDIQDNKGGAYSCRLIRMTEYPSCKPLIKKAVQERKEEIRSHKMKERIHIVLDFSFLRDYMKKGGLMLQTFRCPHCDAPVKLPSSGNQTECKHCGNSIYAQDIFEKVKALIG